MTMKKRLAACALAIVVGAGAMLPVGEIEASPIRPLIFNTYVNGSEVNLKNSINYGGYTYVKLRDIGSVANLGIDFVDPAIGNEMGGAGGGRLAGIHIDQPSFIYTKDNVTDWSSTQPVTYDKCVDITGVWEKYNDAKKYDYSFKHNTLTIADGTVIEFKSFNYQGRRYVPVEEYRAKLHPYMLDICMQ